MRIGFIPIPSEGHEGSSPISFSNPSISADATSGQIDRLLAAGARAYLTKPLDIQKLLVLLDETLRARGPGDASRRA